MLIQNKGKLKWPIGLPGPTRVIQHPSWFWIRPTTLIKHSGSSRHSQGLPAASWDYQHQSEPFSNLQILSETTNIYQQLPGTISPLHHPSMTFSNLQGLSSTTRVYQQLSGTISSNQQPSEPFSNLQVLLVTANILLLITERVSGQRLEWTKVRIGENKFHWKKNQFEQYISIE